MSDIMLHGVLNMPLPDDPSEIGVVEWVQFRASVRQASERIALDTGRTEELEAKLVVAVDALEYIKETLGLYSAKEALAKIKGESQDGMV